MISKHKAENRVRLKRHIRMKISGSAERPRLAIYRSLKHIYAQIIDDAEGKTILTVSDRSKELRSHFVGVRGQVALAKKVGELVAKKAAEKNIKQVVFDRGGYLYHGAVKAMADGAREGGLKF